MKPFIRKFFLFVLLLSGAIAQAQQFRTFTTADGLPSDNVNGVAVDHNNVKWFGTQGGVARYNDTVWITYTTASGLVDNYINCIAVDKGNRVWVGTDVGVCMYNGTQWITYTTASGLIDNMVNYIAGDADGSVWFGTGSGTSNYDGTTWKNYTTAEGLANNMVSCIAVDQAGGRWFGTYLGGLSKYNGSTFTTMTTADSLPDNNIISLATGNNGSKWVGTYYGVAMLDNQDHWVATYRKSDGLYNNFVQDMAPDSKGAMWFANYDLYTMDVGISKKDNAGWTTYSVADGLINAQLKRLAVDKNDNIWIATGAGVSKFSEASSGIAHAHAFPVTVYPNPASTELHLDGLAGSGTLSILEPAGRVLISQPLSKGSNTVALSGIRPGAYILRYQSGKDVHTEKLIIR